MIDRRNFLGASAATGIGLVASRVLPVSAVAPTQQQLLQPNAPDAGGFFRPRGWGVGLGAHEWLYGGDWVVDRVLETLNPDHWHTWTIWPATRTEKRIPALASDTWHDWEQGRQYLRNHPKCEWFAWNEPDMPTQHTTPERAAEITMRFIREAEEIGEDFQVCSPSITLDTTHNGLGWLTAFMKIMRTKHNTFRFSSWNVHPYTCNTVARLRQSMAKWWDWWAIWGSGAPTIIGEVCGEDTDVPGQIAIMDECRAMLDRGDVLGVTWATAHQAQADGVPWEHYHLGALDTQTQTYTLTPLGQHWKELQ